MNWQTGTQHRTIRKSPLVIIAVCLFFMMAALTAHGDEGEQASTGGKNVSANPVHFLVQLHGTRDNWPDSMTADEERIMGEHFDYLQALMWDGKVLLAGPCMDPVYGLVILKVNYEAEAIRIMDQEPSVLGGVHTYTIHPFTPSLLIRRESYAESETDRRMRKEITVNASRDAVWDAWTTAEGVTSFSPPEANIELKVGGKYEWLFGPPESPVGTRGGEGCRILSFLPKEMLSFTWNAPTSLPEARQMRTRVVIQLADAGPNQTKVTLTHLGWGEEEMWNPVYDYFDAAWGRVLSGLEERFKKP